MIVILLRLLLLAIIVFVLYSLVRYVVNPKRKLELALEQKQFFLLDERDNVRKNFFLTYKGVLFEGEKYLGTTDQAFEVVSIFMWTGNPSQLQGLTLSDFEFIEGKVKDRYPHAALDWKSPVKEFLLKSQKP
ncbi:MULTISPECIES: sigma-w pathway protein ysdB [Bacillaceae]|uniref:sigma-w pathway protein ysdB n=1 Tax=Bacillaceae TaxID=186817 RepID=UPI000C76047F|nr:MULTISPECIES: sigma-w pathway protein ysdB [Bacillaceae]PLR68364.1 sigma-w pathway protein ysdB [Bacillus sp. UMB0893]QNG60990.1 sigma-w pathway protein ysdB [Bacillus sp. PAMC26568]